jgi:hypothetical protein
MTIDRSWIENYKASSPGAFQTESPDDASVVFIDGQLSLIVNENMVDWSDFASIYLRKISRFLAMPNVHTVVLAFDNSHSPYAKARTQMKRRSRSAPVEWSELMPLPATIPANHASMLFARPYKRMCIRFIIEQVTLHCKTGALQRVIIDYEGLPFTCTGRGSGREGTYTGNNGAGEGATQFEIACELGECDVKWLRYLKICGVGGIDGISGIGGNGAMILDSIDSDYVQIGMCQVELLGHDAPEIYVKRLLLEPSNAAMAVSGGQTQGPKKKQKKVPGSGSNKENQHPSSSSAAAPVVKKPRQYEYCHVNQVVETMLNTFGKHTPNELQPYIIRMLSFLVAVVGSDFTDGVKWLNATTIFKHGDVLWPGLCTSASIDGDDRLVVCPRMFAEGVIGRLWKDLQFKKLCQSASTRNASFEMLHQELATNTAISLFRRERLVTPMQLRCLVVSSCWVVVYWCEILCPCSLTGGDFGFTRATEKGPIIADDKKPLPPLSKTVAKKASAKADEGWPP